MQNVGLTPFCGELRHTDTRYHRSDAAPALKQTTGRGHAGHGGPYGQGQSGAPPAQSLTSSAPGTITSSPPALIVYVPVTVPYTPPASLVNRPAQTREISLRDNYYSPSLVAVPAGTLVRWKNEGRHGHTVTFPGRWDSGPGGRPSGWNGSTWAAGR